MINPDELKKQRKLILDTLSKFGVKPSQELIKELNKDPNISVPAYLDPHLIPLIPKLYDEKTELPLSAPKLFADLVELAFEGKLSTKALDAVWERLQDHEKQICLLSGFQINTTASLTLIVTYNNLEALKWFNAKLDEIVSKPYLSVTAKPYLANMFPALLNQARNFGNENMIKLLLVIIRKQSEPMDPNKPSDSLWQRKLADGTDLLSVFVDAYFGFVDKWKTGHKDADSLFDAEKAIHAFNAFLRVNLSFDELNQFERDVQLVVKSISNEIHRGVMSSGCKEALKGVILAPEKPKTRLDDLIQEKNTKIEYKSVKVVFDPEDPYVEEQMRKGCEDKAEKKQEIIKPVVDDTLKKEDQPVVVESKVAMDQLTKSIQAMWDYGETLQNANAHKEGRVAKKLATELSIIVAEYTSNKSDMTFDDFKTNFLNELDNEDTKKQMRNYRVAWKTIVANIVIALSGVGALAIAGQLIYSKIKHDRALFFFQDTKTTREKKRDDIKREFDNLKKPK